jgi:hypothetical protein
MARRTGQMIALGPRLELVEVCLPAVTRLPKSPDLRLSARG